MTDRPRKLGDFKRVGHFHAKFYVEGLRCAPIYLAVAYQLELGTTEQHDNITVAMRWHKLGLTGFVL